MIHVKEFYRKTSSVSEGYPDSVPLIKNFKSLEFTSDVTLFAGDNGSGKTTFFNLLAESLQINRIDFPNQIGLDKYKKLKALSNDFSVRYRLAHTKGFFFQGEEFIQYLHYINATISSCQEELERIDIEYTDKSSFARNQARMPYLSTLADLRSLYDQMLTEKSHGEGFIEFFRSRLKNNQVYLLDEPETPLSFQNLLVMTALIKEAVASGSQFIISTHSPVLLAFPDAVIYSIEDGTFVRREYDDLEQIASLKYFLNNKRAFLDHL